MTKKRVSESSISARHDQRRQKRIRQQKIRRYTFFTVLAVIACLAVMFFTPFFNIKTVEIVGNNKLSREVITQQIGDLTGRNLFRTSKLSIRHKLNKLSYVEKVSVKKKPFPAKIVLEITERKPVCQFLYMNKFTIIDSAGKILENAAAQQEGIALAEGVSLISANEGELVGFKDEDTKKIIMDCIEYMEKSGILSGVTKISFEDMTNITFNYQNRLDVICGTHIDFQRKLALFKEAINSNKLTDNSRGTINLSTTGKAIYTP